MRDQIRRILIALLIFTAVQNIFPAVPLPPVLTGLTVNPDGSVTLKWMGSPSTGIAGYVIYLYTNGEGFAIDTINNPGADTYQNNFSSAAWYSESYVVATIDTSGNVSPLSNSLSTIHLLTNADTCSSNIKLDWTKHIPYGLPLTKIRIMVSENGASYLEAAELTPERGDFELSTLNGGNLYCIRIDAIRNDTILSTSNISCRNSGLKRPPAWISVTGYQPIETDRSEITAHYDPMTDLTRFILESSLKGSNQFIKVEEITSSGGNIIFTDPASSSGKQRLYRVSAVNGCGNLVSTSNSLSTIIVDSELTEGKVLIKWTPVSGFSGQTRGYELSRNSGNGFTVIADLAPEDTSYIDDFALFYRDVTTDRVQYSIRATETANPFSPGGFVLSASTSEPLIEQVFAANAFTPDGNNINDLFAPVLSFTPLEFMLEIRTRDGRFLYRTGDWPGGWDGRNMSGEAMPPDVYLWFLKAKSPSGKVITRKGTVSILP